MPLVVAFAQDFLGSANHVAHLETSAARVLGDGWCRDADGSDDVEFFQQVGVRLDQLRRDVNLRFIEMETRLPRHHLFDGCGKGDALVIHPTDFIRQAFDEPSRVGGIVRVATMIRSGLIVDLPLWRRCSAHEFVNCFSKSKLTLLQPPSWSVAAKSKRRRSAYLTILSQC
jgi:hypothetical protein